MADEQIKVEKQGPVMTIRLNRPEKRNAITLEMVRGLGEAADAAAADREVRVVAVRGEGKCFCSGIDFNSLAQLGTAFQATAEFRFHLAGIQEVFNRLERLEKPVIALLHGFCYGMGTELALACDFRIAASDTRMAIQEVELGLVPDVGGTARLTRSAGIPMAKEMIMTGRAIDAGEAHAVRLVNEVVAPDALDDALRRWTERLMGCAPLAVGLAKKIIDRAAHTDKMTFMELEGLAQSALLKTEDVQEGVMARIQKRKPVFKGK